jgi:hypothetical protein
LFSHLAVNANEKEAPVHIEKVSPGELKIRRRKKIKDLDEDSDSQEDFSLDSEDFKDKDL